MRGAEWYYPLSDDARPKGNSLPTVWKALREVALWLGYRGEDDYNLACEDEPDEVRRRLAEAT